MNSDRSRRSALGRRSMLTSRSALRLSLLVTAATLGGCGASPSPHPRLSAVEDDRTEGDASSDERLVPDPGAGRGWTRTPPPSVPISTPESARPRVTVGMLRNGLRIVIVEQHRQPIVSIRAVFDQGSAHDPEGAWGASFFAISLLGGLYEIDESGNRRIEADSFARKVFLAGGELKLSVSADQAFFGIDGYSKDASIYIDMLSRAILRPRCGPTSFVVRRDAMINALEEVELSDPLVLQLFIDRAAFGAGHPYARPVFGSIETLKELSLDQIERRQAQLLEPRRTTILVVGHVDPRAVVRSIRRGFAAWRPGKPSAPAPIRPPRSRPVRSVLLIPRRPAASMLICATRPLADVDARIPVLQVLTSILGGRLDSQLGAELRMKAGLSYSIDATLLERRYARSLVACTVVRAKDTAAALQHFRRVLDDFAARPPSTDQLRRAQRQVIASNAVRYDSTASTTSTWLEGLARGERRPEPLTGVETVSAAEVHRLARRLFAPGRTQFVLGGSSREAHRAARTAGLGPLRRVRLDL